MSGRRFVALVDAIDMWLWPWAKWADAHSVPEMFWGPTEFWYYVGSPRRLWWKVLDWRDHWFAPQQECIDYIDGYCVGYYDTPSRFMWGIYKVHRRRAARTRQDKEGGR